MLAGRLPSETRERAVDAILLVAAKAALGAYVLRSGFSHISDDDYARVVIAQLFAQTPKLDPSGTSWLPFPFWLMGGAMMLFGRALETAQAVAFVCGSLSVVPAYLAFRLIGLSRLCSILAVALAMVTPWNAWLGVATVPEAFTGGLLAFGAVAAGVPKARPWAAAALLVASLSRYEAWPVCAVVAATWCVEAARSRHSAAPSRNLALALAAIAGPLAWMAWNAHAHDGALHFLRRVVEYRNTVAPGSTWTALTTYPRALVTGAPELVAAGLLGMLGLRDPGVRQRWRSPILSVPALLAFLMYGDWSGGAPTHHPERALVAVWWVLAGFGVDGISAWVRSVAWARPRREAWAAAGVAGVAMAAALALPSRVQAAPGRSEDERRDAQIARGSELRASARTGSVEVVPCAYEHFALLAAWGQPEKAPIRAATRSPVTSDCPGVVGMP